MEEGNALYPVSVVKNTLQTTIPVTRKIYTIKKEASKSWMTKFYPSRVKMQMVL
jgi:hypothetical protein